MRGASGSGGQYQISRSLRFNSADSAYLARTLSTNGSGTKGTFNFWVKRSNNRTDGEPDNIYQSSESASNQLRSQFDLSTSGGTNNFRMYGYNSGGTLVLQLETTAVLRDSSAWYCITVNFDTTQATSANRAKVYINGVEQTVFNTATYPTQNTELGFFKNLSAGLNIGSNRAGNAPFASFYLAEFNCIDGTQLTPSSFGEIDTLTGVWKPKRYSGSYGTNGFYLNFSDNSNTTAATLGKDYSGNGNNWTPNNFSVTAGVGNDSLVDVPTSYGLVDTGVGGEVRGNYCTLNPLATGTGKVLVNGNLDFTSSTSAWHFSLGTIGFSSGKYYWEVNMGSSNGSDIFAGIMGSGMPTGTVANGLQDNVAILNQFGSLLFCDDGKYQLDGNTGRVAYTTALGSNQTLGIAVDMDGKSLTFYKDGVSQGAISFSASPMATSFVSPTFSSFYTADSPRVFNFGQRPFAYTAPSGFKALCTQNLPTPTIGATAATRANKYFDVSLWTGNGTSQTLTNSGGFQPDWVWLKSRSSGTNFHNLYDAVRGATKHLFSNTTAAEGTNAQALTAFTSTGFSVGNDNDVNQSSGTYVGWQWNAGGSTVTNTTGSISAQVRANPTAGFSVVTYTGTGSAATVGHGLGVAPSMIIIKGRNAVTNWGVYTSALGNTGALFLNLTDAFTTGSYFNNISPTSSVFTVNGGVSWANDTSSSTHVAYCFAPIAGYSAFGSYTGNGSANGPFVFTGFRPAYVLAKKSSGIEIWYVLDSKRGTYNVNKPRLTPNNSDAESTGYDIMDFTSNGFKLRNSDTSWNANGDTYIFAAFAEVPFKYSLAR